jgi:peptidoglycan hydrolase CwlO-like protein
LHPAGQPRRRVRVTVPISDTLEWLRFAATIITPFAVVALTIFVASRNRKREALTEKMDELLEKIEENEKNCRDDIRAVAVQAQAFQREVYGFQEKVASTYSSRGELFEILRDLRNEIRNRMP